MKKISSKKIKRLAIKGGLITAGLIGEKFVEKGVDVAASKFVPSIQANAHYSKIKGGVAVAVGIGGALYANKISKSHAAYIEDVALGVVAGGTHSLVKESTGMLAGVANRVGSSVKSALGNADANFTYAVPTVSSRQEQMRLERTPSYVEDVDVVESVFAA